MKTKQGDGDAVQNLVDHARGVTIQSGFESINHTDHILTIIQHNNTNNANNNAMITHNDYD